MYVKHRMTALMVLDPVAAKKEIIEAFAKAKCHYGEAAKILGCGHHSFVRWAETLGIRGKLKDLEARAAREGWHHGRKGGAAFHHDPAARARKAARTRRARSRGAAA